MSVVASATSMIRGKGQESHRAVCDDVIYTPQPYLIWTVMGPYHFNGSFSCVSQGGSRALDKILTDRDLGPNPKTCIIFLLGSWVGKGFLGILDNK